MVQWRIAVKRSHFAGFGQVLACVCCCAEHASTCNVLSSSIPKGYPPDVSWGWDTIHAHSQTKSETFPTKGYPANNSQHRYSDESAMHSQGPLYVAIEDLTYIKPKVGCRLFVDYLHSIYIIRNPPKLIATYLYHSICIHHPTPPTSIHRITHHLSIQTQSSNMRLHTTASTLIAGAITLTRLCSASPLFLRDVVPPPAAQARDVVAAIETGSPSPNTTANATAVDYTSSAAATSEAPPTISLAAASSTCFPMMAQVDAINSCGKRYG